MKLSLQLSALVLAPTVLGAALPAVGVGKRASTGPQFTNGEPDDGQGTGGPILGTYLHCPSLDLSMPANTQLNL